MKIQIVLIRVLLEYLSEQVVKQPNIKRIKMKTIKLAGLMLILPVFANAGQAAELVTYLKEAYNGAFDFAHAFLWILAVIPVFAVFLAEKSAMDRLHHEFEQKDRGREFGGRAGMDLDSTFIMVGYAVGAVLAVFLIYGIFGMVYADQASLSDGWSKLVVNVWRGWFVDFDPSNP